MIGIFWLKKLITSGPRAKYRPLTVVTLTYITAKSTDKYIPLRPRPSQKKIPNPKILGFKSTKKQSQLFFSFYLMKALIGPIKRTRRNDITAAKIGANSAKNFKSTLFPLPKSILLTLMKVAKSAQGQISTWVR